jgi:hypothetical protein
MNDCHGFSSRCPGELTGNGQEFEDQVVNYPCGGWMMRKVTVLTCGDCGWFLSITDEGEVLNAYPRAALPQTTPESS